MISEKQSTMERLRGRSKMSVHKEKCNVFTTLQVSILHTGMRSLTQNHTSKVASLDCISLSPNATVFFSTTVPQTTLQ